MDKFDLKAFANLLNPYNVSQIAETPNKALETCKVRASKKNVMPLIPITIKIASETAQNSATKKT